MKLSRIYLFLICALLLFIVDSTSQNLIPGLYQRKLSEGCMECAPGDTIRILNNNRIVWYDSNHEFISQKYQSYYWSQRTKIYDTLTGIRYGDSVLLSSNLSDEYLSKKEFAFFHILNNFDFDNRYELKLQPIDTIKIDLSIDPLIYNSKGKSIIKIFVDGSLVLTKNINTEENILTITGKFFKSAEELPTIEIKYISTDTSVHAPNLEIPLSQTPGKNYPFKVILTTKNIYLKCPYSKFYIQDTILCNVFNRPEHFPIVYGACYQLITNSNPLWSTPLTANNNLSFTWDSSIATSFSQKDFPFQNDLSLNDSNAYVYAYYTIIHYKHGFSMPTTCITNILEVPAKLAYTMANSIKNCYEFHYVYGHNYNNSPKPGEYLIVYASKLYSSYNEATRAKHNAEIEYYFTSGGKLIGHFTYTSIQFICPY